MPITHRSRRSILPTSRWIVGLGFECRDYGMAFPLRSKFRHLPMIRLELRIEHVRWITSGWRGDPLANEARLSSRSRLRRAERAGTISKCNRPEPYCSILGGSCPQNSALRREHDLPGPMGWVAKTVDNRHGRSRKTGLDDSSCSVSAAVYGLLILSS